MSYIVIGVITLLVLILVLYPFKMTLYNQDNYLYINIANFLNLKLNLFVLFDTNHNEDIKKQSKGFRIINKLKFKKIYLRLQGLNFDYRLNGGYYGLLYAIFGFLDKICQMNNIEFNYILNYLGDKSIEFESIFRARIPAVISLFNGE